MTNGQQRNQGLEFIVFGEPLPGLKLLGGVTLLNAILTNTKGGLTNGNQAVGTAPFQFSAGLDWDTPWVKGLGVLGRVVYNGALPWRGPYVFEVQHADTTPGKRGDDAYDVMNYVTSLTVVQPQGVEPLPALPAAKPH